MEGLSGAIVVGGYTNGLTVVRALRGLGLPITVISTRPIDIAQHSRWATEGVELQQFHGSPDSLIDLLLSRKESWRRRAVFPTNDHAAVVMARNRELLSRHYAVSMPEWQTAEALLDKWRTVQTAARLGIETPQIFGWASPTGGEPSCESVDSSRITFPVVVKPRHSHLFYEKFRKKLLLVNSPVELAGALAQFREAGLDAALQEWIPGPDSSFFNYSVFIDRNGEPHGGFSMRKLRKAPPFFGVCRVAETWDEVGLREPTLALLKEIGWRGMANAEYKLDPRDGRFKLMEINGRCFLMQGLPLKAGINYPLMAFKDLSGEQIDAPDGNGWRGVWIHSFADIVYTLFAWNRERVSVGSYLSPYFRKKAHAVWDMRDPVPFLAQWLKGASSAAGLFRSQGIAGVKAGIERVPL
jgi:D-aspartate ligase